MRSYFFGYLRIAYVKRLEYINPIPFSPPISPKMAKFPIKDEPKKKKTNKDKCSQSENIIF